MLPFKRSNFSGLPIDGIGSSVVPEALPLADTVLAFVRWFILSKASITIG